MIISVTPETPDPHRELLLQLRDLVPSAFLDGALDRVALQGALGFDGGDLVSRVVSHFLVGG